MPAKPGTKTPRPTPLEEREETRREQAGTMSQGISWPAMLVLIALAFALAALIAYRLVTPFFHHAGKAEAGFLSYPERS